MVAHGLCMACRMRVPASPWPPRLDGGELLPLFCTMLAMCWLPSLGQSGLVCQKPCSCCQGQVSVVLIALCCWHGGCNSLSSLGPLLELLPWVGVTAEPSLVVEGEPEKVSRP